MLIFMNNKHAGNKNACWFSCNKPTRMLIFRMLFFAEDKHSE